MIVTSFCKSTHSSSHFRVCLYTRINSNHTLVIDCVNKQQINNITSQLCHWFIVSQTVNGSFKVHKFLIPGPKNIIGSETAQWPLASQRKPPALAFIAAADRNTWPAGFRCSFLLPAYLLKLIILHAK